MRTPVSGLNPRMLIWARERSGATIAEVAKSLGKKPEAIENWEEGTDAPTYSQLERLAYQVYKRPIAVFFFPEPPDEPTPEHAFRTLPEFELDELAPDTRYKVRHALALQLALRELDRGETSERRNMLRDIGSPMYLSVSDVAARVRDYLRVDIDTQTSWSTTELALQAWRDAIEDAGIYVFKNAFRQRDISGFCLYDTQYPLIYINNSTAKTRQIFTIFHEVAHLLMQTSGVTKQDDDYIEELAGEARRVEVFCNEFAAEFLLPAHEVQEFIRRGAPTDEQVQDIANTYRVSREVVLRRFLEEGLVSEAEYKRKVAEWNAQYSRRPGAGGDYYRTQATYLGRRYLRLAFSRYYEGAISVDQLADYLNVRVANLPGLEQAALRSLEQSR